MDTQSQSAPKEFLTPTQLNKIDYERARADKTRIHVEMAEVELQKIKGGLIARVDVIAAWENVFAAINAKMLGLSPKIAAVCAGLDDPAEIKKAVDPMIRDALSEMASYRPEVDTTASLLAEQVPEEEEKVVRKRKSTGGRPKKAHSRSNT